MNRQINGYKVSEMESHGDLWVFHRPTCGLNHIWFGKKLIGFKFKVIEIQFGKNESPIYELMSEKICSKPWLFSIVIPKYAGLQQIFPPNPLRGRSWCMAVGQILKRKKRKTTEVVRFSTDEPFLGGTQFFSIPISRSIKHIAPLIPYDTMGSLGKVYESLMFGG